MNSNLIYKVFTRAQWDEAVTSGTFAGAPVDAADGFIHFSNAKQVKETVAKHFSGQKQLRIGVYDATVFGDRLKWEKSRGGELFPHLYDTLDMGLLKSAFDLEDLANGGHRFPDRY